MKYLVAMLALLVTGFIATPKCSQFRVDRPTLEGKIACEARTDCRQRAPQVDGVVKGLVTFAGWRVTG